MTNSALHIRNLTLAVAGKVLFRNLSVDLPERGIIGVMGSMGVGKSSLVSWLCGNAEPHLFQATYDTLQIGGGPLNKRNCPRLLPQKAVRTADEALALLKEMRRQSPPMICVDEVTAGLPPEDATRVLDWLEQTAQTVPVIMISHDQLQVASYADEVILLAAGRLQEKTPAKQFFTAPTSEAGRQFIRTGGTSVANPDANPRHLMSDLREIPADLELTNGDGNTDPTLQWIVKDKLAIFKPSKSNQVTDAELEAISRRGISSVIVLDENHPPDLDALAKAGLVGVWFPMRSDCVPKLPECQLLCQECDRLLASGQKVAVVSGSDGVDAERTIGAQLVHMGLPAGMAAKIMQDAVTDKSLGVSDEQLLWDLELSNDLDDHAITRARRGRDSRQGQAPLAKGSIASFRKGAVRRDVVSS